MHNININMYNPTQSVPPRHASTILPPELWLQILEHASIHEADHLWTSARNVSIQLRDCVEHLFASLYLYELAISLALPRRDPDTSVLVWSVAIPKAQLTMLFDSVTPNKTHALFVSPTELKDGREVLSVEELKTSGALSRHRLVEAPAWVYFNKNYIQGQPLDVPMDIEWDETRKRWISRLEWRKLISVFYKASRVNKAKVLSRTVELTRKQKRSLGRKKGGQLKCQSHVR